MISRVSNLPESGLRIYKLVPKEPGEDLKKFPFRETEDTFERSSGWNFVDKAREQIEQPGLAPKEDAAVKDESLPRETKPSTETHEQPESGAGKPVKSESELSDEEKKQVEELKKTDAKVRAHERAHVAAAGGVAVSGASFEYQSGPDGQKYAVGGEVKIDTSPGKTPEETIRKAQQIKRAALAPSEPSPQDRAVAQQATAMESEARKEQSREEQAEAAGEGKFPGIPSAQDGGIKADPLMRQQMQRAVSAYSAASNIFNAYDSSSFSMVA